MEIIFILFFSHRKKKKHKDKNGKGADRQQKPDIVGMCVSAVLLNINKVHNLLSL